MRLRFLVVLFSVFTLLQPASAQNWRRRKASPPAAPAAKVPAGDNDGVKVASRRPEAQGWVWVSHTIDLAQQLGGEENVWTLDGEPLQPAPKPCVTLGLVIDNEGHIVTRMVGVTPANPPANISVRAQGARPTPATFLGMDAATELCVLKAEGAPLAAPAFSNPPAPRRRLGVWLYGFHPKIDRVASFIAPLYPRCDYFPGLIDKAVDDFRSSAGAPVYYLLTPQLTPAQDCSLILDRDDSVFGVAVYDTGGGGRHLVYPVSRLQTIAQSVIKAQGSVSYGWLGATGEDAPAPAGGGKLQAPAEPGVRILNIAPDSPAEKAGVRPHDIVVAVNDHRVSTQAQMVSLMRRFTPDDEVSLKVRRGDEYKLLTAKLTSAPAVEPEQQFVAFSRKLDDIEKELNSLPPADPHRPALESRKEAWRKFVNGLVDGVWSQAAPDVRLRVLYGFETQPLTGQLMSYFVVSNGLLVSNVSEGAVAARSGLKAGDVILEAAAKPVNRLSDLIDALDSAGGARVEITIARRSERMKITFQR